MNIKKSTIKLISLVAIFALGSMANAQNAATILKKVAATLNAPKDQTLLESVEIIAKGGSVKKRTLQIQQKGDDLRLIRFTAPASVAGVSFLSLGEDRLYLYLPAFRKVRRIASHARNENFMGTDFSYEDLSETAYDQKYSATLQQEDENYWTLKLMPKPNKKTSYSYLLMKIDKATNIPVYSELYDSDGLVKKMEMSDVKKINGYLTAGMIKMTTVKSGHQTIIRLQEAKFDQGLSDKLFTERNLKRWRR